MRILFGHGTPRPLRDHFPQLAESNGTITDGTRHGFPMATSNVDLNWIANYIWGIADDVLRDLYVRGKYRDVILPMTVLRRLDAVFTLRDLRARASRQQLTAATANRPRRDEDERNGSGQ